MTSNCNFVYRRDTRPSREHELGRFFYNIDWSLFQTITSCRFINLGLDSIMPTKKVKLHHNDPLWITKNFKYLVKQRQRAFTSGDRTSYNRYRNQINSPIPCPNNATPLSVSVLSTFNKLKSLNPGKSPGPDNIPNCFFKEHAELLAEPVAIILNSSYEEQNIYLQTGNVLT